jgi:uncharacterized protein (TIGR00251 family)
MRANQTSSLLRVRVQPKGSIDRIDGFLEDGSLKVKVTAPPEKGKANQSVLRLLAKRLGVTPSQVELVSGHGSPRKTIRVIGLEAADVRRRLTQS